MPFDTATAWIHQGADSTKLLVEVASSADQRSYGLSGRPALDPESGMVFVFDSLRAGTQGFWMRRTQVPLDIAFVDAAGEIVRILGMEVCASQVYVEACPSYAPGVDYMSALEANRGWFSEKGIGIGARVTVHP